MKDTAKSFDDLHISSELIENLKERGIRQPTRLETQIFPYLLAGIDTAAELREIERIETFVLPTIERLNPEVDKVQFLIFSPTRQRVRQIASRFNKLGDNKGVKAAAIHHGTESEKQFEALKRANIVCTTPDRLLELQGQKTFEFEKVKLVCFDRANKLFAGNLFDNHEKLIDRISSSYNTAVFADELTARVENYVETELISPEWFRTKNQKKVRSTKQHKYYRTKGLKRDRLFLREIEYESPELGVIYVREDSELEDILRRHGYKTERVSESTDLETQQEIAMNIADRETDFVLLEEEVRLQFTLKSVSHLYFYQLPVNPDHYVRLTNQVPGIEEIISFVAYEDLGDFHILLREYDLSFERLEPTELKQMREQKQQDKTDEFIDFLINRSPIPYGGKIGLAKQLLGYSDQQKRTKAVAKLFELADTFVEDLSGQRFEQKSPAELVDETDDLLESLGLTEEEEKSDEEVASVDEELLEAHDEQKDTQNEGAGKESQKQPEPQRDREPTYPTRKMYINIGNEQFKSEDDLLKSICRHSGFTEEDFKDVSMLDDYSFVKVKEDYFHDIVNVLNRQQIKNKTVKAEKARS